MFDVLFQDYQLYSFDLATNISMDSQIESERAFNSLLSTGLYDEIGEVCHKLSSPVGNDIEPDGLQFSKGERQKLALTRLFYNMKDYIVLDEPFSNLDPITEKNIYDNLMQRLGKKTMIVVSHKLSSIADFDKIMLIDSGSICEYGNHNELMLAKGLYYTMYNKQIEMFKDGEIGV